MPPDRLFQKIRPEHETSFYAVIATLILSLMVILVITAANLDENNAKVSELVTKCFGYCATLLGILFLIWRQKQSHAKDDLRAKKAEEDRKRIEDKLAEDRKKFDEDRKKFEEHVKYVHELNHQIKGNQQTVVSAADLVQKVADKTLETTQELQKELQEKLNGGLHSAVKEELDASPFPTNDKQLAEWREKNCDSAIEKALEKFYSRLEAQGKIKKDC